MDFITFTIPRNSPLFSAPQFILYPRVLSGDQIYSNREAPSKAQASTSQTSPLSFPPEPKRSYEKLKWTTDQEKGLISFVGREFTTVASHQYDSEWPECDLTQFD